MTYLHRLFMSFLIKARDREFALGFNLEKVGNLNAVRELEGRELLSLLYSEPDGFIVFNCPMSKVRSWGGRAINQNHPQVQLLN